MARFTPPLCDRCGDPLASWRDLHAGTAHAGICRPCIERRSAVARSRAIGPYDGSLRAILHAFKYDGCRSLSHRLGDCLRQCADDLLTGADVVVPVPLHRSRWRARGFNQAAELAGRLGAPVLDVLKRTRATPSQTGLSAAARRDNVRNAFTLRRGLDAAGLRIVLVDDVSTTGATIEACARVLRDGGAVEVSAATAARVVSQPTE